MRSLLRSAFLFAKLDIGLHDATGRGVGLQATLAATAATAAVGNEDIVAQLTGSACRAVYQPSVDHDTATHTGTKGNHDKMVHASGTAIDKFAIGGGIGVIAQHKGTVGIFGKFLFEIQQAFDGQIGCPFHTAGVEVAVRGSHANTGKVAHCHGGNALLRVALRHHVFNLLHNVEDIRLKHGVIACGKTAACHNLRVIAHHSNIRIGAAYINSNCIRVLHNDCFLL